MTKDEKKDKEKDLDYLYDSALKEGGNLEDANNMLLDPDKLKDESVQLHDTDYEQELTDAYTESIITIRSLAELYLGNNGEILENEYIRNKIDKDAQNLADIKFLQSMGRKAIIKQMQSIEDADMASPRHFETLYGGFKELREITKQSTVTRSNIEDFYLKLKKDLDIKPKVVNEEEDEEGATLSQKQLNAALENLVSKKK